MSIHTVTAFHYSGLPGRPLRMSDILAPRFLASAFASVPALLILLCLLPGRVTGAQFGREPVRKLAVIVTYAMVINVFFVLMELFTAFYSYLPEHAAPFRYMFTGLDGHGGLTPWTSMALDKGIRLISAGFEPSPPGAVTDYAQSLPEALISLGAWVVGLLNLTVLCKIVVSVRGNVVVEAAR